MEEKIARSTTRQFKAIFPGTLNANDTLFGGKAMQWMDEVAYITATRFTHQRMVTSSTENIRFLKAVNPDSIVEVIGTVMDVGAVRLKIMVEIFAEEMYSDERYKAVDGVFVFVSLGDKNQVKRISY